MVQTRATTKRIDSGQEPLQYTAVTASRTKKRRVDGTESPPKKQRRGKPGELCQLNLDVLFLVRTFPWLSFRPFADRRHGASLPHTFTP